MNTPRTPGPLPSADLVIELPSTAANDGIEFGCRIESSHSSQRIWWRFPAESARLITLRADPFLIATAVYAIGRFGHVSVHGAVSDGLLPNLADFQAAYAAFHGGSAAAPVRYTPLMTAEPALRSRTALGVTAFSGGVDSCFSVYHHTAVSSLAPKRPLGAALMMHGFDIPLEDTAAFVQSAARSKRLTDDAGLELHLGATNVRTLPGAWEDTFGTAVAASLAFFQPGYAFGLIPSFQGFGQAHFDHGSNPLTDPLLSSLAFPIVHDGTRFGRIEKLQHLVQWPAALRELRVCWQGDQLDRNCCRCEKCLRTMLMLRLCGVETCAAFPLPLEPKQLDRLVIRNQSGIDEFSTLLEVARQRGLDEPWIAPARRALRRNRRNRRLWQRGQALAGLVPAGVRRLLRAGGHRWLWRAKTVPPLPGPRHPASSTS